MYTSDTVLGFWKVCKLVKHVYGPNIIMREKLERILLTY